MSGRRHSADVAADKVEALYYKHVDRLSASERDAFCAVITVLREMPEWVRGVRPLDGS